MIEVAPFEEPQREHLVPQLVKWAHAASGPYEDWRFGGTSAALVELERWIRRSSSELAAERWHIASDDGVPVGGAVVLAGNDLTAARRSDLLAIMRSPDAARARERLALTRDLFPPVAPDELYVSRVAVAPEFQGRGIGSALVGHALEVARAQKLAAVRLDVSADNVSARRLYQRFGFAVVSESAAEVDALRYCAMRLTL